MTPPAAEDSQAYLIAQLETLLADVRAGRAVGVACATLSVQGAHDAWWGMTSRCVHAGGALRAAATYLAVRMDGRALLAALADEHESNPALS